MSGRVIRNGLIGAHIGRSRFSAAMDLLCREHGLTLDFTPIDTGDDADFDFPATVRRLIAEGWTGVTVTHPHKMAARDFAGKGMAETVAHLPASNLLVFGPPLAGFNTDYTGFLGAWHDTMGDSAPGVVAVAGAGGVAGAIVPALEALGALEIRVWDTVPGRARALAQSCGPGVRAIDHRDATAAIDEADGLVNATALGMGDDRRTAFPVDHIGTQSWAFDAVYTPVHTPFLKSCDVRGLTAISGFDLFRHMILGAFEAYTGIAPDPDRVLPLIDALKPD